MRDMLRFALSLSLFVVAVSGCSFVVDGALRDRVDAAIEPDAGPPATACTGRPNGTFCDIEGLIDREICLDGVCVISSCGDGFADTRTGHPSMIPPVEVCDDGNPVDGDGCDLDCTFSCASTSDCVDDGEECSGVPTCDTTSHTCGSEALGNGTPCTVAGTSVTGLCRGGVCATGMCPDGLVDAGEECDDDNSIADDGCEPDCTFTCELDEDCQDGNACNGAESCDVASHTCSGGSAPMCDDGDACTTDSCDAAVGCVNASVLVDADGDGHPAISAGCGGDDCNDADDGIFPGAVEGCGTTMDLNCDGMTSSMPTWYADCDRDGYAASGASSVMACSAPTTIPSGCSSVGWTSLAPTSGATDCQATNPSARPGQTAWFSTPISGTNYDYNCSGSSTTEFFRRDSRTFVECAFSRDVCSGTTYWDETTLPACGSTATQSYCRVISVLGLEYCSRGTRETTVRCH